MSPTPLLLDAGVVTRCRRRVHLEHAPGLVEPPSEPDPAADQRIADAAEHRERIRALLAARFPAEWVTIPTDQPVAEREDATARAMEAGAGFIYHAALPRDTEHGRRGHIQLLMRNETGYLPVLVVRHRITDPGSGARTSPLAHPALTDSGVDAKRKARPHPRDQLRLAHIWRMLESAGHQANGPAIGGVIGLDADVVLWHELETASWPGERTALSEYDNRFTDRLAIATAARAEAEPLAEPSRVNECRHCPWWPTCSAQLTAERDVSLVVRGEAAGLLRAAGVHTVDQLADADAPLGMADEVVLARAWLADATMVRRVRTVRVPRAEVELDIDMESFGDAGAYMWGCLLSGADIGVEQGYRAFVTWDPLPSSDEGRSFAEFWRWFAEVRARCAAQGLSFRAYCYNELAENRWLLASADRFGDIEGVPPRAEIRRFIESDRWVDLYRAVSDQFLCAHGKGLKVIAPVAGFHWRDPEAGGENSMRWYRAAVGLTSATIQHGAEPAGAPRLDQRARLLEYNEDDVRATKALREWMSGPAAALPHMNDL